MAQKEKEELNKERDTALEQVSELLDRPMYVLAFIWLVLTIYDFVRGLSPLLSHLMTIIWVLFWVDFIIEFTIASQKVQYLKRNFLTLLALVVPALRLFRGLRFLRIARLMRGTRTIRILGSFNRGMRSLNATLGKRGFGYVVALTLIVVFLGAAGIHAFEDHYEDFGGSLWWSSMMMTTMGSDFFPKTSEGRLLALLLAIYGFSFFGYVTATVASFFVERDEVELQDLKKELQEIKELLKKKN